MSSRGIAWLSIAALNAALWLFILHKREAAKALAGGKLESASAASATRGAKGVAPIVVRTNAFQWGQLESEDYRTYINRLRSIGCPEETIRDIVIADLEKLMAPEVRQAEGKREPPKYWEPKALARTLDTLDKLGKKQDIDFRKREVVRELLGIDLAAERARVKGESDFYEERLGFLDAEKQGRIRMAMEKANREEAALREKSWLENDELTAEDKAQLKEIQKQKDQSIASVLSPDELDQYNLWFSSSAYRVRDAFLVLEPNEADFLALYHIQKEFDDKWEGVDPATLVGVERAAYDQAKQQYENSIREHLGPERYEKYLQTREPDFQQLQDTIAQFGLSPDVAQQVYDFKKTLTDERAKVAGNSSLGAEQRGQIVKALNEETERAMIEVLGPKPYRYYLRSGAGKWLSE